MELGTNLRQLRRKADITQEELAMYLGVTNQAVSKWECGDGYPEITLLPAIAARFKVTIDALLGTDKKPDYNELMEITQRARALVFQGQVEEGIALMRESIANNPGVHTQRMQLAVIYQDMATVITLNGGDNEMRMNYLREAVALYEHILEYSDEQQPKWAVERSLHQLYYTLGEREKLKTLTSRPNSNLFNNGIDLRTPDFALGNDLVFSVQNAIMSLASHLMLMTSRLAEKDYVAGENIIHEALPDEGEWAYTPEERIRILIMGTEIFDLVFSNDYSGFFLIWAASSAEQMVRLALQTGDTECALRALRKTADYTTRFDSDGSAIIAAARFHEALRGITKNNSEQPLDLQARALEQVDSETKALILKPLSSSLLLNHLNTVNTTSGYSSMGPNFSAAMLDILSDGIYDPLRGDARFSEIEELLKRCARTEADPELVEIYDRMMRNVPTQA